MERDKLWHNHRSGFNPAGGVDRRGDDRLIWRHDPLPQHAQRSGRGVRPDRIRARSRSTPAGRRSTTSPTSATCGPTSSRICSAAAPVPGLRGPPRHEHHRRRRQDDPRGERQGRRPRRVHATVHRGLLRRDRDMLNILPADIYPARDGAHRRRWSAIIQTLLDKGFAYRPRTARSTSASAGSRPTASCPTSEPGRNSGPARAWTPTSTRRRASATSRSGRRDEATATSSGRRRDRVQGRPGWHIECSAMSIEVPRRDRSTSTPAAWTTSSRTTRTRSPRPRRPTAQAFVNYWLHCEHLRRGRREDVQVEGQLLHAAGRPGQGIRSARRPISFSSHALPQDAQLHLRGPGPGPGRPPADREFPGASCRAAAKDGPSDPGRPSGWVEEARTGFVAGLEDDLDISEALAAVFTLIKSAYPLLVRGGISGTDARAMRLFLRRGRHGRGRQTGPPAAGTKLEAEIRAKIEARQKARADRDFNRADGIRDELLESGIVLEDTKDGVRWKKAGPPKS